MTYAEKLKDPRWQRRRLEILQNSDFSCARCGDKESTLHIHHRIYRKKKMPWEYEDDELECLCESCHMGAENDKETVAEAMVDKWTADFLTSISVDLLNRSGFYYGLLKLGEVMQGGIHSKIPTGPIPQSRKDAGLRVNERYQSLIHEMSEEMLNSLQDTRSAWNALEVTRP